MNLQGLKFQMMNYGGKQNMSLIQCSSACIYQDEGYCKLDQAAEISSDPADDKCTHFKPKEMKMNSEPKHGALS
jgi:hypothetical protein